MMVNSTHALWSCHLNQDIYHENSHGDKYTFTTTSILLYTTTSKVIAEQSEKVMEFIDQ